MEWGWREREREGSVLRWKTRWMTAGGGGVEWGWRERERRVGIKVEDEVDDSWRGWGGGGEREREGSVLRWKTRWMTAGGGGVGVEREREKGRY